MGIYWNTFSYTLHNIVFLLLLTEVLLENCELIHSGVTLNCESLHKFPNGSSYQNVETLNFYNNNFTELTPNIFKSHSFQDIKRIFIRQNNINHIHPHAFADMLSVIELDLYENNLKYLQDSAFDGLRELKYLDLGHNKLALVEGAIFKHLQNLVTLDLSYNHIRVVSPYLLEHAKVLELYLSGNDLEITRDGSILESNSLTVLTLQSCKLESLHKDTFRNLPNLKYLDISYNRLELISKDVFKSLKYLEQLDISNNEISHLEMNMFHIPSKLEVLLCDENPSDLDIICQTTIQQLHTVQISTINSETENSLIQSVRDENLLSKRSTVHYDQCAAEVSFLPLCYNILREPYNQIFDFNSLPPEVKELICHKNPIEFEKEWKNVFQKFEIHVIPRTTSKHPINNTLAKYGSTELSEEEEENECLMEEIIELVVNEYILVVVYIVSVCGFAARSIKQYQFLQM